MFKKTFWLTCHNFGIITQIWLAFVQLMLATLLSNYSLVELPSYTYTTK